jgi:hypothetical protein
MSDISESGYCAGWESNLEYDLWALVLAYRARADVPLTYGRTRLEAREIEALSELSTLINGWVAWDDGEDGKADERGEGVEAYVPLSTWTDQYQAYREGRAPG